MMAVNVVLSKFLHTNLIAMAGAAAHRVRATNKLGGVSAHAIISKFQHYENFNVILCLFELLSAFSHTKLALF